MLAENTWLKSENARVWAENARLLAIHDDMVKRYNALVSPASQSMDDIVASIRRIIADDC